MADAARGRKKKKWGRIRLSFSLPSTRRANDARNETLDAPSYTYKCTHTRVARASRSCRGVLRWRDAGRNSAAPATHARRAPIESPARRQSLFNPCDIYAHDSSGVVKSLTVWISRKCPINNFFLNYMYRNLKYVARIKVKIWLYDFWRRSLIFEKEKEVWSVLYLSRFINIHACIVIHHFLLQNSQKWGEL